MLQRLNGINHLFLHIVIHLPLFYPLCLLLQSSAPTLLLQFLLLRFPLLDKLIFVKNLQQFEVDLVFLKLKDIRYVFRRFTLSPVIEAVSDKLTEKIGLQCLSIRFSVLRSGPKFYANFLMGRAVD